MLREVRLRRRLGAVRVRPEIDLVQVRLEDPVFLPDLQLGGRQSGGRRAPEIRQALALDLQRQAGLLRLSFPGDVTLDVEVPDELLREGRATLDDLALLQVLDGGADDALEVDARMGVEAPILDRDGGVGQERRDLVERHRLAVLLGGNGAQQ